MHSLSINLKSYPPRVQAMIADTLPRQLPIYSLKEALRISRRLNRSTRGGLLSAFLGALRTNHHDICNGKCYSSNHYVQADHLIIELPEVEVDTPISYLFFFISGSGPEFHLFNNDVPNLMEIRDLRSVFVPY